MLLQLASAPSCLRVFTDMGPIQELRNFRKKFLIFREGGVMEIYDVPQLSEMLKVSVKAVRSYLIAGRLKGRKVGKRWLVHEDAVREFLMDTERIATE